MTDWIEGYKLGFKEGVIALKTQLKNSSSIVAISLMADGALYPIYEDIIKSIDEICKELEGDNG